jgi:phosphomannomutase/phosphoglucomutase
VSIFKSCDIRGVYGLDLDEKTAYLLGRATASRVRGGRVLVGGDLRPSTPSLKAALIEGLLQSGAQVVDIGLVPTPTLYWAKARLAAAAGVMVTASHNPARYNGFKLMFGELPVEPDDVQALAREMERGDFISGQGTLRREEPLPAYADGLALAFPALRTHRLVVDAGNGSMSTVAPGILRRAGQEVVELYCTPDGTFPHRDPNPAVAENLHALSERVLAAGAELGVAYDGDGDRVIFVDGRGRVLPADRALVLLVRHTLREHPGGAVVYDLKSSLVVEQEIIAAGGRALRERSGHAFIKRRLLLEGAVLGGEVSGHYFFAALGGDDALYATLAMLAALDALGLPLAEALDTVPAYPITPDLRLPCPAAEAQQIVTALQVAWRDHPLDTLDGVRIAFPQGWALARISVTEPLLTLRFEAESEKELAAIQRQVRQSVPALDALLAANEAGRRGGRPLPPGQA